MLESFTFVVGFCLELKASVLTGSFTCEQKLN